MNKKMISIIIPMYNEEESLPFLYDRLNKLADKIENYNVEFLFVNDGSKDKSLQIVKEFKKKDDRVCYLNLSRNFGKEVAMGAAFDYVRGDAVAIYHIHNKEWSKNPMIQKYKNKPYKSSSVVI